MPTISVIIPTYNREDFIGRALCSVFSQTHPCQEILVVDDGSTDRTKAVVDSLCEQSPVPIHYLYQENQGPAAARNLGITHAQSGLLAFLDSDDHWRKEKLATQLKAMEECPEFLISHTREQWLRMGVHLNQKKKHLPRHGEIFDHCLQLCVVGMSTVMIRKELFEKVGLFSADLPCCEDYELWLRVSARYPFLLIDQPLTIKEGGREDQVSFQYRVGMDKLRIKAISRLLEQTSLTSTQYEMALEERRRKSQVYGMGCVRHGRAEEGAMYLGLGS
ncbi:MAG: glycosyl [Desulfobulbaceae bacterium]|jgi:glycosyltransferase involved in cell wall biosynthesis|nr:MAG: glycosyl [Desulfobulbaceae bacterium]